MYPFWLALLLLTIVFINKAPSEQSELLSVTVIFRHGSRTPRHFYKNDPYQDRAPEIWPEGLGQLTNVGKRDAFALGEWFRERYESFLPQKYASNSIRALSSNSDRCIMSAACALAGLFPPREEQIWNSNINWQPIPVHSLPGEVDRIIYADETYCPKFDRLLEELKRSEDHLELLEANKPLFEYISKHSGENITTIREVSELHDALFIEESHNLTLPEWTMKFYPNETLRLIPINYIMDTNTTELGRLKSGLLLDYITTFFEDYLKNPESSQKFLMFSGHDSTISRLMNILGVFDWTWPEYSSTLVFELRRKNGEAFLRMYFKDSKKIRDLKMPQCSVDCNFEEFKRITKDFRINDEEWVKECASG